MSVQNTFSSNNFFWEQDRELGIPAPAVELVVCLRHRDETRIRPKGEKEDEVGGWEVVSSKVDAAGGGFTRDVIQIT